MFAVPTAACASLALVTDSSRRLLPVTEPGAIFVAVTAPSVSWYPATALLSTANTFPTVMLLYRLVNASHS